MSNMKKIPKLKSRFSIKNAKKLSLLIFAPLLIWQVSTPQNSYGYGSSNGRIVYSNSQATNIISGNGGNQLDLTYLIGPSAFQSWSPDNNRILYTSFSFGGENIDIAIANPDGSNSQNIAQSTDFNELAGIYSPNGRYIRYIKLPVDTTSSGMKTIVRDMQEGTEVVIPVSIYPAHEPGDGLFNGYHFQPWSPDSSRLIVQDFDTEDTQYPSVGYYVVNKDGTEPVLVAGPAFDPGAGYVPWAISWLSNNEVIFSEYSSVSNSSRIVIYNLELGQRKVLSTSFKPIVMEFMPQINRLVFSEASDGSLSYSDTDKIDIYYSDYNPSSKELGAPVKVSNLSCPSSLPGCDARVSAFFSVSESSILYAGGYSASLANDYVVNLYSFKNGQNSVVKEDIVVDSSPNTSSEVFSSTLTWFNAFETVATDMIDNPENPQNTPRPPRTGRLIGATLISVTIISTMLLIAKELKHRHGTRGN
jgi:hypothetical protein